MHKTSIPWEQAVCLVATESAQSNKIENLDNEDSTLEKERAAFNSLLATKVSPGISVVSIERDDDGLSDRFVLNKLSIRYLARIRDLFRENAVQYEVTDGLYPVPIEGGTPQLQHYRPIQHTVVINRHALRKLKRSPALTLFYAGLCAVALAYVALLFYRIVIA